ncbi:hypothetical protein RCL1_000170 [Eukaryota sp. TZLM3-RCL]
MPQHPMLFCSEELYATFLRNKHSIDARYSLSVFNSAPPVQRVEQVGEWYLNQSRDLGSIPFNYEMPTEEQKTYLKKSLEKSLDFDFVQLRIQLIRRFIPRMFFG